MFSLDFWRVVHNVMAAETRRRRRSELGIKGGPNRCMAEGWPIFFAAANEFKKFGGDYS